jgi:lysophospholipase L1-like esterase
MLAPPHPTRSALVAMVLLACTVAAAPARAGEPSSSPSAARPAAAPAPRVDPAALSFDDVDLGTAITTQYEPRGVVFTSSVFTTVDADSPTSPVLSGSPLFRGEIAARFTDGGSDGSASVDGFALDVGYIDSRDSVVVDYFDADGHVVGSRAAQALGTNHIEVAYRGVAGFSVHTVHDEPAGFAIDNLYVQRGPAGIRPARMASLGDSYSSGEGLLPEPGLDYDCGTDLHAGLYFEDTSLGFPGLWVPGRDCDVRTGSTDAPGDLFGRSPAFYENLCHRDARAYPRQIGAALGIAASDLAFAACSGATTADAGLRPETVVQYPHSPAGVFGAHTQIADVRTFDAGSAPDLVTIGLGGNDGGFSSILKRCLVPLLGCGDAAYQRETVNRVNGTVYANVLETFQGLRREFPAATIVAFGYPSVIGDPADDCARAAGLDQDERAWIGYDLLPAFNSAISDAAQAAGISFADITRATAGHEICADDNWINGLRPGDDILGVIGNESFHPNQRAHDAIARFFVDHYTDGNGQLLMSDPAQSDPLRPARGPELTNGTVSAGAVDSCGIGCQAPVPCVLTCTVHVRGSGFEPGTSLTATLRSDPTDIGTVTSDAAGNVEADLQLPDDVEPGDHSIELHGISPTTGNPQTGVDLIRVYATDPRPAPVEGVGNGDGDAPTGSTGRTEPAAGAGQHEPAHPPVNGRVRATPRLTGLAVNPKRFRVAPRHRAKGSTIRVSVSRAAEVTFTIRSAATGRRVGTFRRALAAGPHRVPFSGRLRGRRLKPGRYRIVAAPTDRAGNRGRRRTAYFTIVPPP